MPAINSIPQKRNVLFDVGSCVWSLFATINPLLWSSSVTFQAPLLFSVSTAARSFSRQQQQCTRSFEFLETFRANLQNFHKFVAYC